MIKYLLLILIIIAGGCVSADIEQFGRVTEHPIKGGVPLYYGVPPAGYSYRDLGPVAGVYSMGLFDGPSDSSLKALKDMAIHARAKGANAVIEVKSMPVGFRQYGFLGEAVVFEDFSSY